MEEIVIESGVKIGIEEKKAMVLGHTDPHLKTLTIPFEIKHHGMEFKVVGIYPKAFSNSELEEISIPSSMVVIGENAFAHCDNLAKINFWDNEDEYRGRMMQCDMFGYLNGLSIDAFAFSYCNSLAEVHIPMYVSEIGKGAFFSCSSLEKVVWNELDQNEIIVTECYSDSPRHCVSIGKSAFAGCEKLAELLLSPLILKLGDSFIADTSIRKIDLLEGKMDIDECAFAFSNLEAIVFPEKCYDIRYGTCMRCEKLRDVVLPSVLWYIGENAFEGCISLEEIHIPRSVKKIDSSSFEDCSNLRRVSCSKKHVPILEKQLSPVTVFDVW